MLLAMSGDPAILDSAERALVERARSGDRQAFDRLVQAHLPRVWRVVFRILRHREDTEDVVQEVFLTAHQALADFRGEAKLATWLHKIAVTRALNHLDRASERARRSSRSLDDPVLDRTGDGVPARDALPDRGPSPLQALEGRELLRRLADCFERLPSAWRAVVALRDGEGLAYEEIAGVLGIALGTVRSRLARARVSLKDCVEGGAP